MSAVAHFLTGFATDFARCHHPGARDAADAGHRILISPNPSAFMTILDGDTKPVSDSRIITTHEKAYTRGKKTRWTSEIAAG
jgi:hypothetical protein